MEEREDPPTMEALTAQVHLVTQQNDALNTQLLLAQTRLDGLEGALVTLKYRTAELERRLGTAPPTPTTVR